MFLLGQYGMTTEKLVEGLTERSSLLTFKLSLCRKLFWTDKGSDSGVPPKVSSADMDGGNLKNLYTGNMARIGFITADISTLKLYWGVAGTGVVCTACLL